MLLKRRSILKYEARHPATLRIPRTRDYGNGHVPFFTTNLQEEAMHTTRTVTILAALTTASFATGAAIAGNAEREQPLEYLVKFDIVGEPSQILPGAFVISGPGYATVTTSSGEILDDKVPGLKVARLTGATIQFTGDLQTDPVIPFTCVAGSCTIEIGGSTLASDAGVPLAGQAIPMWGPVINSHFNPDGSSTPIRILGCGGLKDISGKGEFAGMVGSICFNGVFNVPDFQTSFALTGGSNCTITMHSPVVPIP
jgi:hypothetical protein